MLEMSHIVAFMFSVFPLKEITSFYKPGQNQNTPLTSTSILTALSQRIAASHHPAVGPKMSQAANSIFKALTASTGSRSNCAVKICPFLGMAKRLIAPKDETSRRRINSKKIMFANNWDQNEKRPWSSKFATRLFYSK